MVDNLVTGISPFMRQLLQRSESGEVEAPDNIIKTVSAAYQQYFVLRQDHLERIATYAAIQGMLGGNPPYDQRDLETHGLGHLTNFNNYKGRSTYEKSAGGYWNLINSTEVFVKVVLNPIIPKAKEYADIIAKHFSDVVKEWEDFAPNFNLLGAQLTAFGLCPIIFPHEESPIWEVVDVSRYYIPSQSQVFISKLTTACVETTYTLQTLYSIYKELKEGDDWNKTALGNFLILKANNITNNEYYFTNMMDVERWFNDGSYIVNTYFANNVKLVNMFQQEYDTKISHYIFSPDFYSSVKTNSADMTADFLYFVDRQYEKMEDAIIVFTASPGEWNIHGNVGVGQKVFAGMQAINMLDCSIVDMSIMSSTPLIKTLTAGGRDMAPIRFYPGVVTDIGTAEFQQNNLGANIEQLVGASQYLSAGLERNAINSGDDPSIPDLSQGSISPSQARSRDYREFGVLKNVVAHFYHSFDKVVKTIFVRFLRVKKGVPGYEYAEEWKNRCIEDGVPKELFDTEPVGLKGLPRQFRSVRASRVAGDGSTLARIMNVEALAPLASTFNPKEMAAYKREYIEATVGYDYVPVFASSEGQGDELTGGASLARTEDNLMKGGFEALFSPDNDQEAHTDEHLGTAIGIVQAVQQQQMSPVEAARFMELSIPHLMQHVRYMSQAPLFYRDILARIEKPFKQLVQWSQLNKKNAEAMIQKQIRQNEEDAAKTAQVMSDAERKDFVALRDVERADRKVTAQIERGKDANETRAEIMKEKTRTDAEIKEKKVVLDAQVKNQATALGRAKEELKRTPDDKLREELKDMTGTTPSAVDFEPVI